LKRALSNPPSMPQVVSKLNLPAFGRIGLPRIICKPAYHGKQYGSKILYGRHGDSLLKRHFQASLKCFGTIFSFPPSSIEGSTSTQCSSCIMNNRLSKNTFEAQGIIGIKTVMQFNTFNLQHHPPDSSASCHPLHFHHLPFSPLPLLSVSPTSPYTSIPRP